jgi:predicted O-methyltransferase YrrM
MGFYSGMRTKLGVALVNVIRTRHGVAVFYHDKVRRNELDLIAQVRQERRLLLSDQEALQIMMFTRRTSKIEGDIAEVGTYKGASSKLIAEARGESDRDIYLFDTFEGLPELQEVDRTLFYEQQYGADFDDVSDYLSGYPRVHIYKGIFPSSSGPIKEKKFSFVHLDVDLYEGTKESLEFFYPRMNKGGVIISHDYLSAPGVRKAVDEFMADKPEAIFESSWRQCFIVKGS